MTGKIQADRVHVLKRLKELRDWARYIQDSVSEDQPYEEGKMGRLREDLGEDLLLALRADGISLADRLEEAIDRMDASGQGASRTCAGS